MHPTESTLSKIIKTQKLRFIDSSLQAQPGMQQLEALPRNQTRYNPTRLSLKTKGFQAAFGTRITLDDQVSSAIDSLFANQRRKLRQNTVSFSICNDKSEIENHKSRLGVTVVEVLFAMFVILFGLVALAAIIPMAARQANDSYGMVHGGASMENTFNESATRGLTKPSMSRPWFFVNDIGSVAGHRIETMTDFTQLSNAKQQNDLYFWSRSIVDSEVPFATRSDILKLREAYARGFCLDPVGVAEIRSRRAFDIRNGDIVPFLRRSRMPFFEESTTVSPTAPPNQLFTAASTNSYTPRLLRLSLLDPTSATALPLSQAMSLAITSSGADVNQADFQEDKSFGALRSFQQVLATGQLIGSLPNAQVSWLVTIVPSETSPLGSPPTDFDVSFVVFDNRSRDYQIGDSSVLGADAYPRGERMAIVAGLTSSSGSLQVTLNSDSNVDARLRTGDWIMLSRRIETGNGPTGGINFTRIIHRHRWYRITGLDNQGTWPRQVRLAGPDWDIPEDRPSPNTFSAPRVLNTSITTATIFSHVVGVFHRMVSIE